MSHLLKKYLLSIPLMPELKSRENLITENLRLVHSLCKRFIGKGIEYDDLFQSGCIGLIKAADGFDESRGLMFSTYAVPVILGELKRLFRDGGSVKVSRHLRELNLKIVKATAELENKNGREATLLEISEYLGVDASEVTEAVCACRETVSLTVSNDEEETQFDIAEDSGEEELNNKIMLDTAFSVLSEQERALIIYRYYNGLTQSETAEHLSMSQVQVSRLEKKILLKLRSKIDN